MTLASSSPEVSSTTFPTHPPRASGNARLRQPVFCFSAHRLSQTRRAESLRWHSAPSMPGLYAPGASVPPLRLRDLRRLRRDQNGLVSVHVSNPYASSPSLKPLPPPRLTRPKFVAVVPSFFHPCQSRKDSHLSPRPLSRPAPAAPVGLPAHSPEDRKNDADASPFPTSYESSGGYTTLQGQCVVERHHTPGAMRMNIFT